MNDICLHVATFRCVSCGAIWQHSYPVVRTDDSGYVDIAYPPIYAKWLHRGAQLTCLHQRELETPICHNCAPTNLPSSWPAFKPKEVPHAKRKEPLSHEDLDALLRS